jgi:hypothetical protein
VPFVETETVTPKRGGLALLIEGRGTQPPPAEAMVVHEALALLTYDADAQRYAFRAYQSARGTTNAVDADASLVDGALVWGFRPDPGASLSIRYTISVSAAGEWLEVGEVAPDGQTWQPFFQMTLARQAQAEWRCLVDLMAIRSTKLLGGPGRRHAPPGRTGPDHSVTGR